MNEHTNFHNRHICIPLIYVLGCIEETNEPVDGSNDVAGGILGDPDNPNSSGGGMGGIDDGVTQEEMNLTCYNLMIDVLNSQIELQVKYLSII